VILSIQPWTRKLRLLEARKRAERHKARRRVFVAGDDMAALERVSNVRQAGEAPPTVFSRDFAAARGPIGTGAATGPA
jgi:hypothetical protein